MKKYFIFAAAAALMVAACQKSQTESPVIDPDENLPEGTKVPILFGSNVKSTATKTKSYGSLDALEGRTLVVYGIERNKRYSDLLNFESGILIDGVSATLGTGTDSLEVKNPETGEYYFYSNSKFYDFFGYYIDDMSAEPDVVEESGALGQITIPIAIDGSQDVLVAKAERKDTTVNNIWVSKSRQFSAYTARKDINPNLHFEHQLARLKFKITNGNEPGSSRVISLSKFGVISPTEATLYVASNDTTGTAAWATFHENFNAYLDTTGYEASKDTLFLKARNATTLESEAIASYTIPAAGESEAFGESIMVLPGLAEYPLVFYVTQDDYSSTATTPILQTETIAIPGGAKAGVSYTINLTIYGLEKIVITVDLEEWDEYDDEINIGEDVDETAE